MLIISSIRQCLTYFRLQAISLVGNEVRAALQMGLTALQCHIIRAERMVVF